MPAQQRLARQDAARADVEDRLVIEIERLFLDCGTQVELERAAGLRTSLHFGFEPAPGAAVLGLGAVKRHIGVLQELIGVGILRARDGAADARAYRDLVTIDRVVAINAL